MAIRLTTKNDMLDIAGFADEVASLYLLAVRLQVKIAQYAAAAEAVQAGTATREQLVFAQLVACALDPADLPRIAALVPMLTDWIDMLEANYPDFIHQA